MSLVATTITVDAVDRVYKEAWDAEYEAELKSGSARIGKTTITDGNSIFRVAHGEDKKGIERHVASIRDTLAPAGSEPFTVQVHTVLSFPANNAAALLHAQKLSAGLRGALGAAGFEASLTYGEV